VEFRRNLFRPPGSAERARYTWPPIAVTNPEGIASQSPGFALAYPGIRADANHPTPKALHTSAESEGGPQRGRHAEPDAGDQTPSAFPFQGAYRLATQGALREPWALEGNAFGVKKCITAASVDSYDTPRPEQNRTKAPTVKPPPFAQARASRFRGGDHQTPDSVERPHLWSLVVARAFPFARRRRTAGTSLRWFRPTAQGTMLRKEPPEM
jgi:hypothetical protein